MDFSVLQGKLSTRILQPLFGPQTCLNRTQSHSFERSFQSYCGAVEEVLVSRKNNYYPKFDDTDVLKINAPLPISILICYPQFYAFCGEICLLCTPKQRLILLMYPLVEKILVMYPFLKTIVLMYPMYPKIKIVEHNTLLCILIVLIQS